jgi:hypothetical protein
MAHGPAKRCPRATEAGCDRPDRDAEHRRGVLVVEALSVDNEHRRTLIRRQRGKRLHQIVSLRHRLAGIEPRAGRLGDLLQR